MVSTSVSSDTCRRPPPFFLLLLFSSSDFRAQINTFPAARVALAVAVVTRRSSETKRFS